VVKLIYISRRLYDFNRRENKALKIIVIIILLILFSILLKKHNRQVKEALKVQENESSVKDSNTKDSNIDESDMGEGEE